MTYAEVIRRNFAHAQKHGPLTTAAPTIEATVESAFIRISIDAEGDITVNGETMGCITRTTGSVTLDPRTDEAMQIAGQFLNGW